MLLFSQYGSFTSFLSEKLFDNKLIQLLIFQNKAIRAHTISVQENIEYLHQEYDV